MSMLEPLESERNSPRQDRARQTVETFFEATAQLLERADDGVVTTNHVAERAGFSIGTLYRYFSGKPSLFKAMALHEMERQERDILAALEATDARSVAEIVRLVVRPTLRPFEGRPAVRRALLKAAVKIPGLVQCYEQMVTRITSALVETVVAKAEDCGRRPSPDAEFIMLRGAIGAIRSDVLFGGGRAGTPGFEDALVEMVSAAFRR
ncbi:TetR/AcrR family transcriptional regulator [Rhizobium sp. C4]|uniref:TetR/AcrR family transcriptional regulator n=1 Tax=Rhizobium sp. C4 TaxID=1349800 RepID=UPI001E3ED20A|nr:TetR/AcrR family transcriptional regulator [Rhizobium sp. C4]MCD2173214.1 TetR/AcrR family transcriptional regulator [Rhizobium sp. C4]